MTLTTHVFTRSRFGVAGRAVRVWLPSGYDGRAAARYPVLYLMDGQNLFEPETAFAGVSWRAGETAQKLIDARRIEPLLLVGVDNSGAHRTDDYTPVRWQGRGGAADDFARMLTEEIKPFVDANYRTRPDRASTGIAGASLGGLFALHLALSRPDLFARAAALSPTIWWGHGAILRRIAALPQRPDLRLWIDIGKREAPPLRQQVQRAEQLLLAKGWLAHRNVKKATLRHAEIARGGHDERSWGKRFDRVLKFLFPPVQGRNSKPPRAGTSSGAASKSISMRSKRRARSGTSTS